MSKLPCEFDLGGKRGQPEKPTHRHIPRVAKLMALAIRFDGLVCDGVVADYAELARLGHVTRSRISQIIPAHLLLPLARV